ncbi:MAG: M1 family metallopeptidase [Balneolales bacterium]
MNKIYLILGFIVCVPCLLPGQDQSAYTREDTLRGSITAERAWWDVTFYDLHVSIDPEDSLIRGYNNITYRVTGKPVRMQIDLQKPLEIDRIVQDDRELSYERKGPVHFIEPPAGLQTGSLYTLTVHYSGQPRVAANPPWDGGFVWESDPNGNPWIATANQGIGASVWWPNKDHQSEQPDSMAMHITVADSLINVSNGRLRDKTVNGDGTATWSWFVSQPINNYNVAINAGNYVHFGDTYEGKNGLLDLDYWVLEHNLARAKAQFTQVKPMLDCFEHWFGPYPFYEDSYKIVETPYLGMEHQSAIGYGNNFTNGYRGNDLSGTGWGLKFDFIIIHETGHEWWGNSITSKDIADMWVHEGFTNYSESLYVECMFGKEAGAEYVIGTRTDINNDMPVIGRYGVNQPGSGDMYAKGGNLLHTIRHIIDDDHTWLRILRGLTETYHQRIVTSDQIEGFINRHSHYDLAGVFDQYLRHTEIPVFQYYIDDGKLNYRWQSDTAGFDMPVRARLSDSGFSFIQPLDGQWQSTPVSLDDPSSFEVDENFYVAVEYYSP